MFSRSPSLSMSSNMQKVLPDQQSQRMYAYLQQESGPDSQDMDWEEILLSQFSKKECNNIEGLGHRISSKLSCDNNCP